MARRPPPPKSDDPAAARTRALRLLGRREHSARELQRKLELRGFDQTNASDAVEAMRAAGWQSDARYVETLIHSRVTQGYGPLRIESELEASGVPTVMVREALVSADVDWGEVVATVWSRKFREPPQSAAEWQKQYRHLAARGFEARYIRMVLKGRFDPET